MARQKSRVNRQIPVRKFIELINYLEKVGLDSAEALEHAELSKADLQNTNGRTQLPVMDYSRLYGVAVKQMQSLNIPLPWAAGVGSDAFELMCHSIISCKTLGEALERASRFDHLLYPLLGYRITLTKRDSTFELRYSVKTDISKSSFAPESWEWSEHFETVSHISGLMVWFKFASWLIGHAIELDEVTVAYPSVSPTYDAKLTDIFESPVKFDASACSFSAPIDFLSHRLVHNPESLTQLLNNSVYELTADIDERRSTTNAIRSLISRDIEQTIPSFAQMADYLHCSESSLRRKLLGEDTSYQQIKDELRCEIAMEQLRHGETSVKELARLLHFSEAGSFNRSFKNWVGMTPKEYMEEIQKNH